MRTPLQHRHFSIETPGAHASLTRQHRGYLSKKVLDASSKSDAIPPEPPGCRSPETHHDAGCAGRVLKASRHRVEAVLKRFPPQDGECGRRCFLSKQYATAFGIRADLRLPAA
ncbi:hypothetical protein D3C85_1525470 [compost metagenome]